MSALAKLNNGYLDATRSTGNPRDVEYQLFARVTGRLNKGTQPETPFNQLVDALNENLGIWREVALSVADPDNELPAALRAQLFYLYEFTVAQTQKVLRGEAKAAALIEVNMSIMRGLRTNQPGKGPDPCLASS